MCRARERDLQHAGPRRDRMICDAALVSERFEFSLEADELCLETERVLRETERVSETESLRDRETERQRERQRQRETWYALVNMKYRACCIHGSIDLRSCENSRQTNSEMSLHASSSHLEPQLALRSF